MNYRDKSTLVLNGKSFIERIISQMSLFRTIMIISNKENDYFSNINAEIYSDIVKGIGPLGGIHSALTHSNEEKVFITSCDMPLIRTDLIELVCSNKDFDITVPTYKGNYEMLFALYSKNCLPYIEKQIQNKRYKLTNLLEQRNLKIREIPIDDDFISSLKNINSPEDYSMLKQN